MRYNNYMTQFIEAAIRPSFFPDLVRGVDQFRVEQKKVNSKNAFERSGARRILDDTREIYEAEGVDVYQNFYWNRDNIYVGWFAWGYGRPVLNTRNRNVATKELQVRAEPRGEVSVYTLSNVVGLTTRWRDVEDGLDKYDRTIKDLIGLGIDFAQMRYRGRIFDRCST